MADIATINGSAVAGLATNDGVAAENIATRNGLIWPQPAVIINYLGTQTVVGSTTLTWSSVDLGTNGTSRKIVFGGFSSGSNTSDSSATIDGNTATRIGSTVKNGTVSNGCMYYYDGDVGATGDITITYSPATQRTKLVWWEVLNAATGAPENNYSSTAGPGSNSASCSANGGMAAYSGSANPGNATTWAGLTEDSDDTADPGGGISGASKVFASAQTGLTVSSTRGAYASPIQQVASFAPA